MRYSILIILGLLFVALFINGCVQQTATTGESTETTSGGEETDESEVLGELDSTLMDDEDDVEVGDII